MTLTSEIIGREDDPRRQRILNGAMKVFLAYGFQRTTMDDIAKASDISRPALYLQFRNKTDIYRALAAIFLDQAVDIAATAMRRNGPLNERMDAAIDGMLGLVQGVEDEPHGEEILDMKNSLAGDLIASCRVRMQEIFCEAMRAEAIRNGVDPQKRGQPVEALASMLLDALDGMKMRRPSMEEQIEARRYYARTVLAALER